MNLYMNLFKTKTMKIKLGVKVKDKITGFEGIVIGHSKWLTGCDTYTVKPTVDKEGKIGDAEYFDEGALDIVGDGIHAKEAKSRKNGGPRSDHPQA